MGNFKHLLHQESQSLLKFAHLLAVLYIILMQMKKNYFATTRLLVGYAIVMLLLTTACSKNKSNPEPEITEEEKLDESIKAVVPEISIQIDGNQEVKEKEVYLTATVSIKGNGVYPDLAPIKTRIKGRGNSTWELPKKPYKLKLDNKASLLGLGAAKEWVLLANYQDYTLMTNAIAMKIGQQLAMPFTNTIIPADLIVNGTYRGSYNLTQQIEVKENRVDLGKDDLLLELDSNFDEAYKFKSKGLNLPVMVKNPDITAPAILDEIKAGFEAFEQLLLDSKFPGNNYGDYIDKQQLVNFLVVNNLTGNFEVNHPKSVFIHKATGGKYTMGPIWDFDWGFGMDEDSHKYFSWTNVPLLKDGDTRLGAKFLSIFMKDPEIRSLYKQTWKNYKNGKFEALLSYIETYAATIRDSQKKDYERWKVGDNNLPKSKADMKIYLRKRAAYIDAYVNGL